MAKIIFKKKRESIIVDDVIGRDIQQAKENGDDSTTWVNLGIRGGCHLGDVGMVLFEDMEEKDDDTFEKMVADYYDSRVKFLKHPLEERVKYSLNHFRLFYNAVMMSNPSDDLKVKAKEKIRKFFQDNPKWTIPSLVVYKDLVEPHKSDKANPFQIGVIKILEKAEANEIHLAGKPII